MSEGHTILKIKAEICVQLGQEKNQNKQMEPTLALRSKIMNLATTFSTAATNVEKQ